MIRDISVYCFSMNHPIFLHRIILVDYYSCDAQWNVRIILSIYLVGPYYAGPKSTPAHFTPALIPPRENFDLPPFRAAFNATIGKNQKNQEKGKVHNNNYLQ